MRRHGDQVAADAVCNGDIQGDPEGLHEGGEQLRICRQEGKLAKVQGREERQHAEPDHLH